MTVCPDCGCRVYRLGCVNCNEAAYIEQQRLIDDEPTCDGCAQPTSECLCDIDLDDVDDCASVFHPGCRKCETQ